MNIADTVRLRFSRSVFAAENSASFLQSLLFTFRVIVMIINVYVTIPNVQNSAFNGCKLAVGQPANWLSLPKPSGQVE